ncbi:MAG: iron-sulfur cluster assembly protein [candidate division WOR-3 bacterium]
MIGADRWRRIVVVALLVIAGSVLVILPHWLRFGRRAVTPLVLQGRGRLTGRPAPDTLLLLYRLSLVSDPELGTDIFRLGLVESLDFDTLGNVRLVLGLTTPYCPFVEPLGRAVLETLVNTPGINGVTVRVDPQIRVRR